MGKQLIGIATWLEQHWVSPAYSGWLLLGLMIFFLGAATNTLAGWLYVISGGMAALLAIATRMPVRQLDHLELRRSPLSPRSVGDPLSIRLDLTNGDNGGKGPLQIIDPLPEALGGCQTHAVAYLPARSAVSCQYRSYARQRGIYPWPAVVVRTAAPLGLTWRRRTLETPGTLVIYPKILPLRHCPILEAAGQGGEGLDDRRQGQIEGLTRSLRPYRWGDPSRLIHWRTSARLGELRVREVDSPHRKPAITLALHTTAPWSTDDFEQAVMATASLYDYARRQGHPVTLWLSPGRQYRDRPAVMAALAAIAITPPTAPLPLPSLPLVWLSCIPQGDLPPGSQQIIWGQSPDLGGSYRTSSLLRIDSQAPLAAQLEGKLT
jgi:uncharacterized protein (DUF58 family)